VNVEDEHSSYFSEKKGKKQEKNYTLQLKVLKAVCATRSVLTPKPEDGTHDTSIICASKKSCGTSVSCILLNIYFDYLNKDI